jgi:hypothetical protein
VQSPMRLLTVGTNMDAAHFALQQIHERRKRQLF